MAGETMASEELKIRLNDQLINFDVEPKIVNNRTLVPIRRIFELLKIKIKWVKETKTVIGFKENTKITLKINDEIANINNKKVKLESPPIIFKGRTLVPIRFIAESTGVIVEWDSNTRTVNLLDKSINNINIGDSKERVLKILGKPSRKDLSKYGFKWYIYKSDYNRYIQVGIKNERVVGIYTNAKKYKINNISIGANRQKIHDIYGEPLKGIQKENTFYTFNSGNGEFDTFLKNGYYITIFYNINNNYKVTAFQLIEKGVEQSLKDFYGKNSEELKESFEKQLYDLANAIRVRNGLTVFDWDEEISKTARKHSKDMAANNYFSHINLKDENPFDRMENDGIDFIRAAENIATGQTSAIFAHENLLNSPGHRDNILGEYNNLGVGVHFGGKFKIYYTQNFFTQD
ncbi:MAG: copper amine oxidase [Firmicutes bacterium]|nr:copper amine oxidase [Bacillota bacterium]